MTATDEPTFPDIEGPAWATRYLDSQATPLDEPERAWMGPLIEREHFTARLERFDYCALDTGSISVGQTTLQVVVGRNDAIDFIDPARVREAARQLLEAADLWEAAVVDERPGE